VNFAAAQYEQEYLPKRLGNWQVNPSLNSKVTTLLVKGPAVALLSCNGTTAAARHAVLTGDTAYWCNVLS
jgi:hypothetical protein